MKKFKECKMDLVVKISDRCNFACTFCSSNQIAVNHKDLDIEKLKSFIHAHKNINNIIVNGGDPLMVSPEYYENLLQFIEGNKLNIHVSFTTNLLAFWKDPNKWTPILKRVGVCTSFQYGNDRRLADGTVFSEEMFREVFKLFEERVGYKLKFITVINENNENTVMKTVQLAKELGTTCKINGALMSGRTTSPYPFYKMVEHYIAIIKAGYGQYEDNCALIVDAFKGNITECPFNKRCHESIRCMSPDGTVHSCPAIADDILKGVPEAIKCTGAKLEFDYTVVNANCPACKCYNICNSCTKRIMDLKNSNTAEEYCENMKKLIKKMEKWFDEDNLYKTN